MTALGLSPPVTLVNVPNVITAARTAASVGLAVAALTHRSVHLLVAAYLIYWIGDILDGVAARALGQETRTGAVRHRRRPCLHVRLRRRPCRPAARHRPSGRGVPRPVHGHRPVAEPDVPALAAAEPELLRPRRSAHLPVELVSAGQGAEHRRGGDPGHRRAGGRGRRVRPRSRRGEGRLVGLRRPVAGGPAAHQP
ncbi:CDP-alcohol phosphatidyltransferase family protein [Micromonospora sp. M12]